MLVRAKNLELSDEHYSNLSELTEAMGISVSQVYRVKKDKRRINRKSIVGAVKAFFGRRPDDFFYLAAETPITTQASQK
jgi:hypothetical protein